MYDPSVPKQPTVKLFFSSGEIKKDMMERMMGRDIYRLSSDFY